MTESERWRDVCAAEELEISWGEAALIDGHQYALFRVPDGTVFATDHRDPNSGAFVMARGIVGSAGEAWTITSPLYKEVYELSTGRCLNSEEYSLPIYPTRISEGRLQIHV